MAQFVPSVEVVRERLRQLLLSRLDSLQRSINSLNFEQEQNPSFPRATDASALSQAFGSSRETANRTLDRVRRLITSNDLLQGDSQTELIQSFITNVVPTLNQELALVTQGVSDPEIAALGSGGQFIASPAQAISQYIVPSMTPDNAFSDQDGQAAVLTEEALADSVTIATDIIRTALTGIGQPLGFEIQSAATEVPNLTTEQIERQNQRNQGLEEQTSGDLGSDLFGIQPFDGDLSEDQEVNTLPYGSLPSNFSITKRMGDLGETGLPDGFFGPNINDDTLIEVPHRYDQRFGDHVRVFSHMSMEAIAGVQAQMVEGGYLASDAFRVGTPDLITRQAMAQLMEYSDGNGLTWQDGLVRSIETNGPRVAAAKGISNPVSPQDIFTPRSFLAPSPDTLANDVFNTFQQILGRKPSAEELGEYMSFLNTQATAQFNTEESARFREAQSRADTLTQLQEQAELAGVDSEDVASLIGSGAFSHIPENERVQAVTDHLLATRQAASDRRRQAGEGGDNLLVGATPASGTAVDPRAAFLNRFRTQFEPEVQLNQRRDFNQAAQTQASQGFLGFMSMIRNNPFS